MERDKDYKSGCIVFILLTLWIITMCGACSYGEDLKKVKSENRDLKREIAQKEDKISDLEKLNKNYEWQIEQVPYIIEYGCNAK